MMTIRWQIPRSAFFRATAALPLFSQIGRGNPKGLGTGLMVLPICSIIMFGLFLAPRAPLGQRSNRELTMQSVDGSI